MAEENKDQLSQGFDELANNDTAENVNESESNVDDPESKVEEKKEEKKKGSNIFSLASFAAKQTISKIGEAAAKKREKSIGDSYIRHKPPVKDGIPLGAYSWGEIANGDKDSPAGDNETEPPPSSENESNETEPPPSSENESSRPDPSTSTGRAGLFARVFGKAKTTGGFLGRAGAATGRASVIAGKATGRASAIAGKATGGFLATEGQKIKSDYKSATAKRKESAARRKESATINKPGKIKRRRGLFEAIIDTVDDISELGDTVQSLRGKPRGPANFGRLARLQRRRAMKDREVEDQEYLRNIQPFLDSPEGHKLSREELLQLIHQQQVRQKRATRSRLLGDASGIVGGMSRTTSGGGGGGAGGGLRVPRTNNPTRPLSSKFEYQRAPDNEVSDFLEIWEENYPKSFQKLLEEGHDSRAMIKNLVSRYSTQWSKLKKLYSENKRGM